MGIKATVVCVSGYLLYVWMEGFVDKTSGKQQKKNLSNFSPYQNNQIMSKFGPIVEIPC